MESENQQSLVKLLFLGSVFLFFAAVSFYFPRRIGVVQKVGVLSEATSSGSTSDGSSSGETTFSPTPSTFEESNSGSGSTSSGDSSGDSTTVITTAPTLTTTGSDDSSTSTSETDNIDNSGSGSFSSGDSTTNRLASVDSATLSCIKSRLTSSEFDIIRFLMPTTGVEEETLKLVIEKAKICFENYSETKNLNLATSFASEMPSETEDCLKKFLGDDTFAEIDSGLRAPTSSEKEKSRSCFSGSTNEVKIQTREEDLSDDINKCLVLALGSSRYRQITNGTTLPTAAERQKAARCFGVSTNPFKPNVRYLISDKVKNCVSESVDEARFEDIKLGKSKPSEQEKSDVNLCFEDTNRVQSKILPVPSEQVAFLDEADEDKLKISSSFTSEVEVSPGLRTVSRVFNGIGPENSSVDIYIFSDPIVVTTETDENGEFSYKLTDPLDGGSHIAYVTYKDRTGSSVRSAVYNFEVTAAETADTALLPENNVSTASSKYLRYAIALILISLVFVIGGIYYFIKFKKGFDKNKEVNTEEKQAVQKENSTAGSQSGVDGQGESKGSTGTVN